MPPNPPCAHKAPSAPTLTDYDLQHLVTNWRVLNADNEAADWREVSRLVLHIEPNKDTARARRAFESHLCARDGWPIRDIDICCEVRENVSSATRRCRPPVRMIKLIELREITPYKWVYPDEER